VRARLLLSSFLIALVAVIVLGVPLAVFGIQRARDEAWDRLQRDAQAAAALVGAGEGRLPVARLASQAGPGRAVIVASPEGTRTVVGRLPAGDTARASARAEDGAVVTIVAPAGDVSGGVGGVLLVVGLSAVGSLAAALALGWWLSRRFARPLEALATASRRLGSGDFGVRAGRYDLAEVDAVAAALDRSAERLGELMARERAFSANAAHQLRTPLTALRLRLEELVDATEPPARDEAVAALAQADRLERTVEDLLALARHGRAGDAEPLDLAILVRDRARSWSPAYRRAHRPLEVQAPETAVARTARGAVEQAVDVLLDNALRHGRGTVRLSVRRIDGYAVVAVGDEGGGIPAGAEQAVFERPASEAGGTGLGLSLARTLVETGGGRLHLAVARPPLFEIVLPADDDARRPRGRAAVGPWTAA
jgi:signal transduction histidine kinase